MQRRTFLACAGAALTGAGARAWSARERARDPAALRPLAWIADHDRDELLLLSEGLTILRRAALSAPIACASWGAGVCAATRDGEIVLADGEGRTLLRVRGGGGRAGGETPWGACLALAREGRELLVLRAQRPPMRITLGPASALAVRGAAVLVAFESGRLARFELDPQPILRGTHDTPTCWTALAPGPRGGWWALARDRAGSLGLLGGDLRPQRTCADLPGMHWLSGAPGGKTAWIGAGRVAARLSEDLGPALFSEPLALDAIQGLLALEDGGALAMGSGAVLRLDRHGVARASQGGFAFLRALAPA
jgi:hypothetical protein